MQVKINSSAFVSGYTSKRGPAFTVGGLTRTELESLASSPVGRKLGLTVRLARYDAAESAKSSPVPVKRASKRASS